jgi:1,5-anhydro-D-fructose reductase (1,5-anhydro-D-mannitol-forming)
MTVTLGWAIISTGRHADHKIAPAINAAPHARLAAVFSRDQARAEAFAERHGAMAAYDSIEAMLQDARVDAVFIVSPNALHAAHAVQAAQAGKHVLTEKPMATSIEDAASMIQACRRHAVRLGVGFHLRYHPAHLEAYRALREGTLGTIALVQGQWGFGVRGQTMPPPRPPLQQWWEDPALIGGASTMMGTGVHVVDLFRFLLEQEVVEVTALADGQTPSQPLEQLLTLAMRFEDGPLATICCGRRLPDSQNDVVIYGSHGRLAGRGTLWEAREGSLEIVSETTHYTDEFAHDFLANYVDEVEDFYHAVVEQREPAATGLDGLRAVEVTLAMITAARERCTVKIERHTP